MQALGQLKLVFSAALFAFCSYSAPVAAQQTNTNIAPSQEQSAPATKPLTPLRVVDRGLFCTRVQQAFVSYGQASGFDSVHTALLANGATAELVQEFRSGRASDYMKTDAVRAYARVGTPAPRTPEEAYLPMAGVIGQAMGIGANVTLALSSAELRYIPGAQRGTDIVVIAHNAAALSAERAQKVIDIANNMQIHVSVIWVGDQDAGRDVEDARSLAWIAAKTGGAFANLGGDDSPCGGQTL